MGTHSGSAACPAEPASAGVKGEAIAESQFQHLITIISWVCFGVTTLLWLGIAIPHLCRYKAPNEQRQILRIISTPVVFAIIAVISINVYKVTQYVKPIAKLYEAYALASLFLLYVHYVAPEAHTREEFFHNLENISKSGGVVAGGSLRWFLVCKLDSLICISFSYNLQRTWRIVFFYVLIYTILVIIEEITLATGVYCKTSSKPRFAHVWLQALQLISTICVLMVIIRFQRRLKSYMLGRKAFLKLIGFKLLVFLTTLQHVSFLPLPKPSANFQLILLL